MKIVKLLMVIWILTGCSSISKQAANIFTCKNKVEIVATDLLKVDTSGMMVDYGGQLINKQQSLFCTHWNIFGEEVTFIARNGEKVKRTVVGVQQLGHDVCILTFDKELDPKQHWIAPVADLSQATQVTVFRYKDRKPISVKVESDFFYHGMWSTEYNVFKCVPGKSVRPGDSGKGWYAMIDGKIHLVGINSFITFNILSEPIAAFSPEVGEIYNPKYWKLSSK